MSRSENMLWYLNLSVRYSRLRHCLTLEPIDRGKKWNTTFFSSILLLENKQITYFKLLKNVFEMTVKTSVDMIFRSFFFHLVRLLSFTLKHHVKVEQGLGQLFFSLPYCQQSDTEHLTATSFSASTLFSPSTVPSPPPPHPKANLFYIPKYLYFHEGH